MVTQKLNSAGKFVSKPAVVVTESDFDRLRALVDSPRHRATHAPLLMVLRESLDRASVVGAGQVPDDVVTMRSRVRVRDPRAGETDDYTLVYPEEADLDARKLSVLAPMGLAMLGAWAGQTVVFEAPSGRRRLKIDRLLYQPEASGDFHL
jgi:regulator of nucleoside diphosphate kinase